MPGVMECSEGGREGGREGKFINPLHLFPTLRMSGRYISPPSSHNFSHCSSYVASWCAQGKFLFLLDPLLGQINVVNIVTYCFLKSLYLFIYI